MRTIKGSGRAEWPTWLLIVSIYGGWVSLLANASALPSLLLFPGLTLILCLHSSLQHELIHGHPGTSARLNAALAYPPLSLWLPFQVYRDSHLAHHRSAHLSNPYEDPESYYISPADWAQSASLQRKLWMGLNTLAGRLTAGPWVAVLRCWRRSLLEARYRGVWLRHWLSVGVLVWWICEVSGMAFWQYLLFAVWPGQSLIMLRSYLEHRPAAQQAHRTAVVEAGWLWRLLFLNNNYHSLHHEQPGLPWFLLHRYYWRERDAILHRNGAYVFAGYCELLRRFAVQVKDSPVHPMQAGKQGQP